MNDVSIQGERWSVSPLLSPELRAVLVCAEGVVGCAQEGGLSAALAACPSAEELCTALLRHGMLGHLHSLFAGGSVAADPALVERVAELQRAIELRNLRQTARLLQILQTLDAAGIRALPVKGPVWAQALYGDIARRHWSDLDVLVSRDQAEFARATLLSHGYSDCGLFNERMLSPRKGDRGQIALLAPTGGVTVDLHWAIAVATGPQPLTIERVMPRALDLELLGHRILRPGKSDTYLICIMQGTRDRWCTVGRILDLAIQVAAIAADEWPLLLLSAREAGCERRCVVGTAHVCRVLGMEPPALIAGAFASDRTLRRLAQSLDPSGLSAGSLPSPRQRWAALRWQAASEDHRLDNLRHLSARFLAPSPEDWAAVRLPPRLEWLFPIMRPWRLALKWLGLASAGRRSGEGDG